MRVVLPWVLTLCLGVAGCSREAMPLPPIRVASAEVAALRVFVVNASDEAARLAGETTVTGYTIQTRTAVQRSLSRAGLTVVVSPTAPTDLLAKVDIEHPSLYKPGMVSMTLATPEGIVIEQVSSVITIDENVDIDERGPVTLIEKMARSARIMNFARGHRRGECETIGVPKKKVLEVPAEGN